MVCIVDRLQKTLNRKISSEQIWKHLKTMYNLKALDDLEPLPFPNNEEHFDLPLELQTKLKKRSESEDGESSSKESSDRKSTSVAANNSTTSLTSTTTAQVTTSSLSSQKPNTNNKSSSSNSERNDRKSHKPSEHSERIQPKRTRGSIHHDITIDGNNSSPASTPPNQQATKRRRI